MALGRDACAEPARAALTEDQSALFAAHTSLTQERKVWEIALAEAQANVTNCTASWRRPKQLRERQALVDQLAPQRMTYCSNAIDSRGSLSRNALSWTPNARSYSPPLQRRADANVVPVWTID